MDATTAKAALVNKVDGLKAELSKAKVEAFWEMSRAMDTNEYVPVLAVRAIILLSY